MKNGKKVYAWDACIMIAWLTEEKNDPVLFEGIENAAREIDNNEVYLVVSALILAEVYLDRLPDVARTTFDRFLKRSNVHVQDGNRRIFTLANEIRQFYDKVGIKIKTPDATHLATAIDNEVDEFHTNDQSDLNRLVNPVAGKYDLKICRPSPPPQIGIAFGPPPVP
jgi:hypothetical protein